MEARIVVVMWTTKSSVYGRSRRMMRSLRRMLTTAPAGPGASPRREQRNRKDHLLGRDATVQERAPIARLVLAQLGGIHEEAIRCREEQAHPQPHARQAEALQVFDLDRRLRVFALQVLAELVPQVGGGVPLGVHGRRRLAVDRAVIGGQEDGHAPSLGLPECCEHRRALEPRAGEATQWRLVLRPLVADRAFRAAVCTWVHAVGPGVR